MEEGDHTTLHPGPDRRVFFLSLQNGGIDRLRGVDLLSILGNIPIPDEKMFRPT
jgi:hypothetical protein